MLSFKSFLLIFSEKLNYFLKLVVTEQSFSSMEIFAWRVGPGEVIDIFLDALLFPQKFLLIHGIASPHNG